MSMPKGKHSSQQSGFRISHVPTYRVPPNQPGPTDGGSTYSMNVNHYQQPPPQPGAASQPPQSAGGPPPQQQPPPSAQMRVAMQHAVMQQQQPPQQQQQQPPPSQQQQQPPPGPPPHQQQQQQHPTPTSTPPSADMGKTPLVSQHPQMQQQTMSQLGYNPRAPTNGGVFRMANPSQSRIQPNRNLVQVLQPSMQVGFPPISNLQHLQNPHQHFSMPQFQPSGRQHTQGSSHLYYQTIPVNFATPQIGSYPNYFILPNSVGSSGQYISAPAPIRQYATPGNAAAAAAAAAAGQMPPGLGGGGHSAAANHAVAAAAAMGVTALGPGATQSMLQQQQPPPQMASQHPQQQPTQNYQKAKRKHAIPIINPDTMKEIDDIITPTPSGNSITPPISTDSSARQTPQPGSAVSQDTSDVTADQQQTPSFHPHSHPTPHLTDIKPPAANGGAGAGADDTRAGPATAETVTTVTVTANGPTSLDISETQVPISEVKTASKPPPQPYSTAAAADKTTKVASSVQEKQRDSAATPIVSASDEIMTPRTISNKETTPSSKDSAAKGAANVAQSQSPAKSLNRKQSGRGGAPSESASASEKSQTQSPVVVATPVATALAAATESQAKPQPAAAADAQPVVAASAQPAAQSPAPVEATAAVKKETPAAVEAAPKEETPKEKTKPPASAKESAAAATPAQQAPPPAAAAVEPIVVPVEQKQPAFSTTPSFAQLINFSPLQKPTMPPPQVIVPPPPAAAVAADNETTTATTKTHTNGEIPADSPEGKACQRQATKKNKKLKEFNQKGAKKEGSEMDAFTENNVEEKEKSVTPQPTTTPLTVNNKLPPSDVTSKDDLQEKLVAAKNEENIKVSALSKQQTAGEQGDNNNTTTALPIIDKTQSTPAQPQQPVLKHKYKEDQWSPLNPEGKKKYDREFLMGLQNDPQATKKPDNLPNIDIVQLEPPNRNKFSNQISYSQPSRGGTHDFAPNFFKSSSMRGSLPKRNSQQGNKGAKPTKAVHLSTSLREDKRLKDSENAWKPTRLKEAKDVTEEDKKTQELYKKVRSILNKLTPQKFDTLVSQVRKLPIDTPERMNGVINLVFDKAIAEPGYSKAYAGMCKLVSNMEVKDSTSEKNDKNGENEKKVVFRKSLIMRCQFEFESNKNAELCSAKRLKEIDECTDHEKKRELQLSYEEEERRIRKKSVGNVRFIGELYILDMLTAPIMHRCINELLQKHEEEPLECLCKLLTTIGKKLENATIKINEAARLEKQKELTSLDTYFAAMKDLSQKRDNSKLSSRVRFMLQDVIDLKQNNWVPRRDENNPKTMDQIQREANRESMEMSISLQSHRKQDMRSGGGGGGGGFGGDDRRGGGGGRNRSMNQNDDKDGGWQSVGSGKNMRQPQYLMESYRLTMLKQQAEEPRQLTLGSSNAFGQWRLGASAAKSSSMGGEQKSIVTSSNKYEALTRERGSDERKGPSMTFKSGGGGRISHSPSMEKERPTLDNKEDTERRSSSQRRPQLSQPSSRDHTPTPSAAPAPPPASSAPTPSTNNPPPTPDKEIRRTAIATLEEFILNKNVEEALQCVGIFTNPVDKMNLVKQMLEYSLESKSKAFQGLGKLLVELIKGEILTADPLVLTVFNEYLDFAVESEAWIDSPKVFQYFSEVIVPLVQSSMLSFRHLADMCKRLKETAADIYMKAMMANIITSLIKEFSNEWVKNKWISSNVEPSDFGFDANDANDQKILQFLSSTRSEAPTSSRMSMNEVQTKLVGFLKSDNMKYEEICDWIESNVGEDIQKPAFISALITAICEVSVDITKKPFTDNLLKNHSNLIRKYVSSYDVQDLEVQCLRSVAAFVNKLQHPPGLLLTIFSHLWDASLISSESFISWKEVDAVEEGMGVALMSLVSFFTSLNEGDSDGNS